MHGRRIGIKERLTTAFICITISKGDKVFERREVRRSHKAAENDRGNDFIEHLEITFGKNAGWGGRSE